MRHPDGGFQISVGALGRSAEAVVESREPDAVDAAFVQAIRNLYAKL